MTASLAFDVYGTLIDPHGIITALKPLVGSEKASAFSQTWRNKQLEYSFRRGLMRVYEEFPVCTRQALDYSCLAHDCDIDESDKEQLMNLYKMLPAFADVEAGLLALTEMDVRLFAFSNGVERDIRSLLSNAGLIDLFEGIVSVDEVQSFKPDPEVYIHYLKKTRSEAASTWLISSNPFDVLGAVACGWQSVWLQRDANIIFDPWNIEPSTIIKSFEELPKISHGFS